MAKKITDKNGDTYVEVKPWYKRWWVWVLAIVVLLFIIGSASGGSDNSSSSKSSSSSKTSSVQTVKKNTAEKVTLGSGTYTVGKDIKPGRYVITSTNGSGNLMSKGSGDINIILGQSEDDDAGQVTSYTTTLKKDEKIKIDGIQSTLFTPTPSKRSYQTTLTAGKWVVGKDIKPGRYEIKATKGSGNLISDNGDINEILGTSADSDNGQVTKTTQTLHDGETLKVELQEVQLIKK